MVIGDNRMGNRRFDDLAKAAAEGSLRSRLKKGLLGGFAGAVLVGSAAGAASADVIVDTSGDGVIVRTDNVLVDTTGDRQTDNVVVDTSGDGVRVVTDGVVVVTGDGDDDVVVS
jgi:hypothetical protein